MSIVTVPGLVAGVPGLHPRGKRDARPSRARFYLTVDPRLRAHLLVAVRPGSIQADIAAAPPNGSYFLCVTFNAGAFPQGCFFGVDPFLQEIADQVNVGPPFVGPRRPERRRRRSARSPACALGSHDLRGGDRVPGAARRDADVVDGAEDLHDSLRPSLERGRL